MRIFLLVAIAGFLGLCWSSSAYAQSPPPADGEIRGHVYHDLNGNGVLDPDEPNANQVFRLSLVGEDYGDQVSSFESGGFIFDGVPPGEYTVAVDLAQETSSCIGPPTDVFSYQPLGLQTLCADVAQLWDPTTPSSLAVTVESGAATEVTFGARPQDVVTVAGGVIVEDDLAPLPTIVEAHFADHLCGSTTSSFEPANGVFQSRARSSFQMEVFGAGERPGCPNPGDDVQLTLGGAPAGEFTWYPFAQLPDLGFIVANAVAIEDNAWYWGSSFGDYSHLGEASVQATIGATVCGESTLGYVPILGESVEDTVDAGFGKLIVPSEDVQAGCGRSGTTVTFTVNGAPVGSMIWQPGLQEVQLDLSKAGVKLPPTGSGGADKSGIATILMLLVTTLAALGSAAVALSLAKVARPHRR